MKFIPERGPLFLLALGSIALVFATPVRGAGLMVESVSHHHLSVGFASFSPTIPLEFVASTGFDAVLSSRVAGPWQVEASSQVVATDILLRHSLDFDMSCDAPCPAASLVASFGFKAQVPSPGVSVMGSFSYDNLIHLGNEISVPAGASFLGALVGGGLLYGGAASTVVTLMTGGPFSGVHPFLENPVIVPAGRHDMIIDISFAFPGSTTDYATRTTNSLHLNLDVTLIPEPHAWMLMGFGLAFVVVCAFRRSRMDMPIGDQASWVTGRMLAVVGPHSL